jgi:hypothetical protein
MVAAQRALRSRRERHVGCYWQRSMERVAACLLALLLAAPVAAESPLERPAARVKRCMFRFASPTAPPRVQDLLELARAHDRMRLFRDFSVDRGGLLEGAVLFGLTTVLAAHLPQPARIVFEAPVHAGPSLMGDGGVGAAVGGRF